MTSAATSKRGNIEEAEVGFFTLLVGIPIVNSAVSTASEYYSSTKSKSKALSFAFSLVENGCQVATNAAKPVVAIFEKPITTADTYASDALLKIEDRYPIIKRPTEKVVQKSKKTAVQTGRSLLNSGPGQLLMKTLAKSIDVSEHVLEYILPQADKSSEKGEEVNEPTQHEYCDCEIAQSGAVFITQTEPLQPPPKKTSRKVVTLVNLVRQVTSLPLQIWTDTLRKVYNYLLEISTNKKSPRKSGARSPNSIARRLKKTPKKRIHAMSLLNQMLKYLPLSENTVRVLGMKISRGSRHGDIRKYLILSSPTDEEGNPVPIKPHDAEKKRKHDETLSDSDVSSEFDPETYRSSEDENYSPGEEGTTDSLEYASSKSDEEDATEEFKKLIEESKDVGPEERTKEKPKKESEEETEKDLDEKEAEQKTGTTDKDDHPVDSDSKVKDNDAHQQKSTSDKEEEKVESKKVTVDAVISKVAAIEAEKVPDPAAQTAPTRTE